VALSISGERKNGRRGNPHTIGEELPGLDSDCHNSYAGNGQAIHQDTLSHALPTSHVEDPDLARIVAIWDRLTEQVKRRLIELLPKEWNGDRVGD
jgi:hypothetical protein